MSLRFDRPLDIDDITEFHVARLLILLRFAGEGPRGLIRGRTKLAKLDFLLRYPKFLEAALVKRRMAGVTSPSYQAGLEGMESSMIRYRFGPWDHRYYDLLGYMLAKDLVRIGAGTVETYSLSPLGLQVARELSSEAAFAPLIRRAMIIRDSVGDLTGTALKEFIYQTFEDEVSALAMGQVIHQ